MTRAVEAIIFSSKIVGHGAEDMNKSLAGSQRTCVTVPFRDDYISELHKILSRVLHLPEGAHFPCSSHLCLKHQNLGWHHIITGFPSSSACEKFASFCANSRFRRWSLMSFSASVLVPSLSIISFNTFCPPHSSSSLSVLSSSSAFRAAFCAVTLAADRNVDRLGDSGSSGCSSGVDSHLLLLLPLLLSSSAAAATFAAALIAANRIDRLVRDSGSSSSLLLGLLLLLCLVMLVMLRLPSSVVVVVANFYICDQTVFFFV
jgi:hypothetical protein